MSGESQFDELSTQAPPLSPAVLWREWRLTFALGVPIILSSVGNVVIGAVNTVVIGRVSSAALAGVAAGNALFWPIVMAGTGLMNGLDTLISQAYGERAFRQCDQTFGQGLLVWLIASLTLTPLMYFASDYYALTGAQPEVVAHAIPYLKVMSFNFAPVLLFYTFQRYWQAQGVATMFTVIIILANIVNYLFAVGFVQGAFGLPALGSAGVGYASLICRIFCDSAILGYSVILWRRRGQRGGERLRTLDLVRWRSALMRRLFQLGLPSAGQITIEMSAFALTTTIVARLGATALAAHQIVYVIASFTFMFPLGLASASAVRVGAMVGKGDIIAARRAGWLGIVAGGMIMSCFGLVMCLAPGWILGLFSHDETVVTLAMGIILLAAIFQIFDGIQVVSTGVLRGAGNTKFAFLSNFVGYYCIGLPIGALLCFHYSWHIRGLWLGLALGLIFAAFTNTLYWRRYSRQEKEFGVEGHS